MGRAGPQPTPGKADAMMADLLPLLPLLPLAPVFVMVGLIVAGGRAVRNAEARADRRYTTWMAAHAGPRGGFVKCAHPNCPSCPDVMP